MVPIAPAPPRASASKCMAEKINIIPDEFEEFMKVDTIDKLDDIVMKLRNIDVVDIAITANTRGFRMPVVFL